MGFLPGLAGSTEDTNTFEPTTKFDGFLLLTNFHHWEKYFYDFVAWIGYVMICIVNTDKYNEGWERHENRIGKRVSCANQKELLSSLFVGKQMAKSEWRESMRIGVSSSLV